MPAHLLMEPHRRLGSTFAAIAVFALALALTGCEDSTPTAAFEALPAAASAVGTNRTDGAFVFRGRVPGAVLMVDFDRERTLVVGHTAAQLAAICATGIAPEELSVHELTSPKGVIHLLTRTGPLPAIVWQVLSFDPCADLQGVEPLAEGTAQAVYTDSDFFDTGNGAASFGLTAQGHLMESETGTPVKLNAKFRNVFLPDGTIKLPVIDILLRPIDR